MVYFLKNYSIAFQWLTIFWSDPSLKPDDQEKAKATAFFPMVGLFVGIVLNLIHAILTILFPEDLVDFIIVCLLAMTSGGLHLVGFTDVIENLYDRKSVDKIETSSCHGFMKKASAVFLVASQSIKWVLLTQISPHAKGFAIMLLPLASHWVMLQVCYLAKFCHQSDDGFNDFFKWVSLKELMIGTVTTGIVFILLLKLKAFSVIFIIILITLIIALVYRFSGTALKENTLGFSHEVSGIVFLLTFCILFSRFIG